MWYGISEGWNEWYTTWHFFGYLLGYIEETLTRISEGWNDYRTGGLALVCCVGQIFGPVMRIRYGPVLR